MINKGKFIVIEGTDGTGKATQVALLKRKLQKMKIICKTLDFPFYTKDIYGKLVGRYLAGEFGGANDVNPYLISLAYAGDRMLQKEKIKDWLNKGYTVIANRYVSANMGHQTAKLPPDKREEYLQWLKDLEYKTNGIPKEDLVILLYAPPEFGQKNVDKKKERSYLSGKKRDIHEGNIEHLQGSSEVYLFLSKREKHWVRVDCVEDESFRPREDIHQEIVKILKDKKIIPVNKNYDK